VAAELVVVPEPGGEDGEHVVVEVEEVGPIGEVEVVAGEEAQRRLPPLRMRGACWRAAHT
jgi:hypothetical protein